MSRENIHYRLTFEDTKNKQLQLKRFIRARIKKPIIKHEQEEDYCDMVADALLSQGKTKKCRIKLPPDFKYAYLKLANNLHTGLLKMIDDINDEGYITLSFGLEKYDIPAELVWESLYKQCLDEFPHALAEALHISKEIPDLRQEEVTVNAEDLED